MQDEVSVKRNVIPRWHPLLATEASALSSIRLPDKELFQPNLHKLSEEVKIWRDEESISAASDLLDTFLLTGDRRTLNLAIKKLKPYKDQAPPRLLDAVRAVFAPSRSHLDWRKTIANREADESFVQHSVRIHRRRLVEYPRDGLLHVELARLYTILGNLEKAEHHINISRIMSPNNRYILRSMMQFYAICDELQQGLKYIRQSDILKSDPWIQSAEIAAATALGRPSSIASRRLLKTDREGVLPKNLSELAMALATLDHSNGVKERKVFQLVGSALPHSTENGFAQAIWLSNRSTREFSSRFPEAKPSDDAFEAQVWLSIKNKDFVAAAQFAELWLSDQPFSADAAIIYLNLRSMHVEPDERSLAFAKRALIIHSDNWSVMNSCVLFFSETGDFYNAHASLLKMEKLAGVEGVGPFLSAAKGFLAFAEGRFSDGRSSYEDAIRIARAKRDSHLIVNALMFWFRAEATNGLLTDSFIEEASGNIDQLVEKVQHKDKEFLLDIWSAVRQKIAKREWPDREKDGQAIAARVAEYRDEPTFL